MFELIDLIIVRPIINILFVIYNFVGDFGVAIIIFTVLVKFLMWPLVKRQLHQTKLMRKIQPELAEIKKNCNGNRQLESLQMMDLYKRHNIKPFRSVLTLFIQLPIFFSLFMAINVMVRPQPDQGTTCGNTKSHEWLKTEDGLAVVGLTDFAQNALGDIVFISLPEEGDEVTAGQSFSDVESVKAVSEVFSPVTGIVAEINDKLLDDPALVNEDPYGAWLIKVSEPGETEELLDAAAYEAVCAAEEEA